MFKDILSRLLGSSEQKETLRQGYLNVTCNSCPATTQVEANYGATSVQVPSSAVNWAKGHFSNPDEGVVRDPFPSRYSYKAGGNNLHNRFTLSVTPERGQAGGFLVSPRSIVFDASGHHRFGNNA